MCEHCAIINETIRGLFLIFRAKRARLQGPPPVIASSRIEPVTLMRFGGPKDAICPKAAPIFPITQQSRSTIRRFSR